MTTPTIFSDKAINPEQAKFVPQGVLSQKAVVTIPAGTVATTAIGLIRVQAGFTLTGLAISSADLDTGTTVTLDVGYVLDGTTGEDPDAYFAAATIAQDGTAIVWPSNASSLSVATSPRIGEDGYISITLAAGPTTTAGDITVIADFSYDM